jgi:N-methylhydantoinase B
MVAGNVETSQRITDALLGALAQAAPERIPAASSETMNNLTLGGYDSRAKKNFAYYENHRRRNGRVAGGSWRKRRPHPHDQ